MFALEATFNAGTRSKSAPMLADFLFFNLKTSKNYDLGVAGEKLAVAMFEDAGFHARRLGYAGGSDIRVIDKNTGLIFEVEVKTANRSGCRNCWQFCLNKPERTSTSHSAYILLICIENKRLFTYLIPSQFFGKTKQFAITSHPENYKGKVASFRQRSALDFAAANEVYKLAMLQ